MTLPSNYIFVADVAGLMLDECYRFEKEELFAEFKFLEDEKGKDGKGCHVLELMVKLLIKSC